MKKLVLIGLTFFFCYGVWAQNVVNDANAEKRTVEHFHAIRVSDGIDLYITQGSEEALAVSASKPDYRERIKTVVENGVLRISYDWSWKKLNWHNRRLKAYVSVQTLDELRAGGGSDVYAESGIKVSNLTLTVSGGGDFRGTVNADNMKIRLSGGSDIRINGTVTNVSVKGSGGSDFKGYGLVAEYAVIDLSGGSDAQITVNREMAAEASGGSDVYYKGTAVIKLSSASGGSSIVRRG